MIDVSKNVRLIAAVLGVGFAIEKKQEDGLNGVHDAIADVNKKSEDLIEVKIRQELILDSIQSLHDADDHIQEYVKRRCNYYKDTPGGD